MNWLKPVPEPPVEVKLKNLRQSYELSEVGYGLRKKEIKTGPTFGDAREYRIALAVSDVKMKYFS